jgi:hypothetical protein
MEFSGFGKIARLSRGCVVTEKIDGTNAQVRVVRFPRSNGDSEPTGDGMGVCVFRETDGAWYALYAGSRTRWITPAQDNYGFAAWAWLHRRELVNGLGEGEHFGEWWGLGIQRGYGVQDKRFSLFNTGVWGAGGAREKERPECCGVVPVLWQGGVDTGRISEVLADLAGGGSVAAPGYMRPEGVVVYHVAGGHLYKKTIERDEEPKGKRG